MHDDRPVEAGAGAGAVVGAGKAVMHDDRPVGESAGLGDEGEDGDAGEPSGSVWSEKQPPSLRGAVGQPPRAASPPARAAVSARPGTLKRMEHVTQSWKGAKGTGAAAGAEPDPWAPQKPAVEDGPGSGAGAPAGHVWGLGPEKRLPHGVADPSPLPRVPTPPSPVRPEAPGPSRPAAGGSKRKPPGSGVYGSGGTAGLPARGSGGYASVLTMTVVSSLVALVFRASPAARACVAARLRTGGGAPAPRAQAGAAAVLPAGAAASGRPARRVGATAADGWVSSTDDGWADAEAGPSAAHPRPARPSSGRPAVPSSAGSASPGILPLKGAAALDAADSLRGGGGRQPRGIPGSAAVDDLDLGEEWGDDW